MATELIVWERDGRVETVRVPDEGLTLGRAPPPYGAGYCTTNSAVSRQHCRVARLGDGWFIEDLGSANGTRINGELADGTMALRIGDMIVLGGDEGVRAQLVSRSRPSGGFDDVTTEFFDRDPLDRIRTSYDIVAARYATELADDMVVRPLERGLLLSFAELVQPLGEGVVGDIGCGPGHVAKALGRLGVRTIGFDLSHAMIEQARLKFPEGDFRVGSMFELPIPSGAWLGAIALWSTLHFNAEDRAAALREMCRVTMAGGFVLHSFYESAPDQPSGSVYHLERWFGFTVDLDTYFVSLETAADEMERAGFDVMAAVAREAMNEAELPTRRCYILGRRR